MNNQFERYPEYKDSGVEWLGDVPTSWELTRLGTRFTERRTKVSDKDFEPLSVTKQGILPQLDTAAKSNDGDNRKLVMSGDFVINSRSDRKGSSGVSPLSGSVSLINIVLEPKNINPIFCNYLLKSYNFIEEFYRNGHGIVADLWTTRYDEMRSILISIPPIEEQKRIAEFLDKKTAQIDQAISQKQQLIELLKERRQIVIHNAVTRGLNPDAPMKPSGIDWIGLIPTHWQIKKLKHISLINPTSKPAPLDRNTLIEFIPMENVDESNGVIKKYNYRPLKEVNQGYTSFRNDDIIFAKITPCMENGNCAIVSNLSHDICYGSTEFVVFRNNYLVNNGFLYLLLRSKSLRNIFEINMHGSAGQKRIGTDFIANFSVTLPPINEQQQIVEYLDKITTKIEAAITCKQNEIEKLKEYKATLINSAVTGKIKV